MSMGATKLDQDNIFSALDALETRHRPLISVYPVFMPVKIEERVTNLLVGSRKRCRPEL